MSGLLWGLVLLGPWLVVGAVTLVAFAGEVPGLVREMVDLLRPRCRAYWVVA